MVLRVVARLRMLGVNEVLNDHGRPRPQVERLPAAEGAPVEVPGHLELQTGSVAEKQPRRPVVPWAVDVDSRRVQLSGVVSRVRLVLLRNTVSRQREHGYPGARAVGCVGGKAEPVITADRSQPGRGAS